MARVYITQPFPGDGAAMIEHAGHDVTVHDGDGSPPRPALLSGVAGCEAVLCHLSESIDAEVMDAAGPGLKVISNYAVGFNNIDVPEATRRGIVVCNTPGVLSEATADIAWALLLGMARRVAEGDRLMRTGAWTGWKPAELLGGDLVGRTLAIVGAGRIGYCVARRAMGWNMKIVYVARRRHEEFERDFAAPMVDLDEALRTADFVSLHVPLTDQTKHMIDARRLQLMKPAAYLINTARGAVVDESALVEALRAGTIAGAGLDVYEHEPRMTPGLADCANVLLLPHLGSAAVGTRTAMGRIAADNLLAVLAGGEPEHPVNPEAIRGR